MVPVSWPKKENSAMVLPGQWKKKYLPNSSEGFP